MYSPIRKSLKKFISLVPVHKEDSVYDGLNLTYHLKNIEFSYVCVLYILIVHTYVYLHIYVYYVQAV